MLNDRVSAFTGLTCHLGLKDRLSGCIVQACGAEEGQGKSVEAGTGSVTREMCLGDRRDWATVGLGTGAAGSS